MEGADTMSYTHLSFSACPALIGGWWLTCSSEYASSKLWERSCLKRHFAGSAMH